MSKRRRNFGFGRKIHFAGQQILRAYYGGGHHESRDTYGHRWNAICDWLAEIDIRDMRDIQPCHIEAFADERLEEGYAISSTHNDISTANVILGYATRGRWRSLSPTAIAGPRSSVRTIVPASLDRAVDRAARAKLQQHRRALAVWMLARELGVRSREASLADLIVWQRQAQKFGEVNVQEGTKGGRTAPRWVALTDSAHDALQYALSVRCDDSNNLLSQSEKYRDWRNGPLRAGRDALHSAGIRGYHDARAAYACERYLELTGYDAPVVTAGRRAGRDTDHYVRDIIGVELGHARRSVTSSYVGGGR